MEEAHPEMEEGTEFIDPLAASTPKKRRIDSDDFDNTDSILFYSEENTDSLIFYSVSTLKDEFCFIHHCLAMEHNVPTLRTALVAMFWDSEEPTAMAISQLLKEDCCHKGCLKYFSPAEVCQTRDHFMSKTREEQRQYLVDCTSISTVGTSSETSKPAFHL